MPFVRIALLTAFLFALCAAAGRAETPAYRITKAVSLGPPDQWDYLAFDSGSRRVFVTHSSEVTIVDGGSGDIVGRIQGFGGIHGIAVVPELGKAYANSREKSAVIEIDLSPLRAVKEIAVSADSDALIYDPVSKRIFNMDGDGRIATVIDAGCWEPTPSSQRETFPPGPWRGPWPSTLRAAGSISSPPMLLTSIPMPSRSSSATGSRAEPFS